MFKDAYTKLDKEETAKMVLLFKPRLDVSFDPDATTVMVHVLPFYKDWTLAELSRHDQYPPVTRTVLYHPGGDFRVITWSNDIIYSLNKTVPVTLTKETMTDYVRFFFNYVRGKHGRFLIVDSVDDIDWREEPALAGRKALGRMIEPLGVKKREDDGTVIFKATFVFKDSLFQADVRLKPDGEVSMSNEELLVEGIPVADDLFGQ